MLHSFKCEWLSSARSELINLPKVLHGSEFSSTQMKLVSSLLSSSDGAKKKNHVDFLLLSYTDMNGTHIKQCMQPILVVR